MWRVTGDRWRVMGDEATSDGWRSYEVMECLEWQKWQKHWWKVWEGWNEIWIKWQRDGVEYGSWHSHNFLLKPFTLLFFFFFDSFSPLAKIGIWDFLVPSPTCPTSVTQPCPTSSVITYPHSLLAPLRLSHFPNLGVSKHLLVASPGFTRLLIVFGYHSSP